MPSENILNQLSLGFNSYLFISYMSGIDTVSIRNALMCDEASTLTFWSYPLRLKNSKVQSFQGKNELLRKAGCAREKNIKIAIRLIFKLKFLADRRLP